MKSNLIKGATHYLLKSKDTIINLIIVLILGSAIAYLLQTETMAIRGEEYQIFILYILLLGMTLILENAMIVDLTLKDKLSKRLEFFLASGIKLKDLIMAYTIQMFRISGVIPFLLFMFSFYMIDWKTELMKIALVYISTLILCYAEVLLLNTFVLTVKRFKLFKNIVFFGNFLLIYLSTTIAPTIIDMVNRIGLSLPIVIIIFNALISFMMLASVYFRFKKLDNEVVIRRESKWA